MAVGAVFVYRDVVEYTLGGRSYVLYERKEWMEIPTTQLYMQSFDLALCAII